MYSVNLQEKVKEEIDESNQHRSKRTLEGLNKLSQKIVIGKVNNISISVEMQ